MSIPLEAQCVPQWVDMAGTVLAVPSERGVYPVRVPIPAASPNLTPAQDSRKLREIQARSPLPSAVLILILSQKSIRLILPGELAES
ncbi:hypothetical protein B0H13DRAFT_2312791 [Mycena leptocephala]|nr:hypothetical protein B0H13DRAFT_2312791 [Mycena leptocephala]